jgi:hypothetical protein
MREAEMGSRNDDMPRAEPMLYKKAKATPPASARAMVPKLAPKATAAPVFDLLSSLPWPNSSLPPLVCATSEPDCVGEAPADLDGLAEAVALGLKGSWAPHGWSARQADWQALSEEGQFFTHWEPHSVHVK